MCKSTLFPPKVFFSFHFFSVFFLFHVFSCLLFFHQNIAGYFNIYVWGISTSLSIFHPSSCGLLAGLNRLSLAEGEHSYISIISTLICSAQICIWQFCIWLHLKSLSKPVHVYFIHPFFLRVFPAKAV